MQIWDVSDKEDDVPFSSCTWAMRNARSGFITSPSQPFTLFLRFVLGRPDPSSMASREGDEERVISSSPLPDVTNLGVSIGKTESSLLDGNGVEE